MGLPNINISFESLGLSAIKRSEKGVVALILKNNQVDSKRASKEKSYVFKNLSEVKKDNFNEEEYKSIEMIFRGTPNKVLVESGTVEECLKRLEYKAFNYLTCPSIEEDELIIVKSWIMTQRKNNKMRKAVLPNFDADEESIINFATEDIVVGQDTYTANQFCPRIAGILAGLPFTRSSTYYVLNEVNSIKMSENPDEDIDDGKLILVNDGRKIKIGRGVNSLTSTTDKKSDEFKKIKIVEAMDLMKEDIKNTFEDEYVGKVNNSYDNKMLFVSGVNNYLKKLQKDGVLDPNNDAIIDIDYDAQVEYLESKGLDLESMSEAQVRAFNTGSNVYLKGTVKPLDAMEDLELILNI